MYTNQPLKILIISGDLGEGHRQAALAIKEAAIQMHSNVEVAVVDFVEWTYPHIHTWGKYLFIQGIKKFPTIYGYLFHKTRKPSSLSSILNKLMLHGLAKTVRLLRQYDPHVVVSTFPAASSVLSMLKKDGLTDLPTVTVMTDHTDHSSWIHPYTDHYIVGSQQVHKSLRQLGIDDYKISVTGIPVRTPFCYSYDRSKLAPKYGLDAHLPTVLIMGGGYGLISEALLGILTGNAINQRIQFIVVCGKNEKLRGEVKQFARGSIHPILVTGYVEHIHEFMAISDLLITKAGGLTTSEAIAQELPMIIFKPLPGQEQDNTAFLLHSGVALRADDEFDLVEQLNQLLDHPHRLQFMKKNALLLQMKGATYEAVDSIIRLQQSIPWMKHIRISTF